MVHSPLMMVEWAPDMPGPQRDQRGQHRLYLEAVYKHLLVSWGGGDWVCLVLRPVFGPLYRPRVLDDDECTAVSGMRISRGNWKFTKVVSMGILDLTPCFRRNVTLYMIVITVCDLASAPKLLGRFSEEFGIRDFHQKLSGSSDF
jgi:hypothetical protein